MASSKNRAPSLKTMSVDSYGSLDSLFESKQIIKIYSCDSLMSDVHVFGKSFPRNFSDTGLKKLQVQNSINILLVVYIRRHLIHYDTN